MDRRLHAIRDELLTVDIDATRRRFDLPADAEPLKTTISLCPRCLTHVPAAVYERGGRVWIRPRCDDHGPAVGVIENDIDFYRLSNKDAWGRRFRDDLVHQLPPRSGGGCCGDDGCGSGASCGSSTGDASDRPWTDQSSNKSCTVLVEVTDACNLNCRVCYSDARGDRVLSVEQFRRYLDRAVRDRGGLDSVQLTGGEASMHPQFWTLVDDVYRRDGVRRIYLPTNGILFDNDAAVARLADYRDKLLVLLQFDGARRETNRRLRRAHPAVLRARLVDRLGVAGVAMQLTMTLTRGVNEDEAGWVVDTAYRHRHIKLVAMQPATFSGRHDLDVDPTDRLTLSDVVKSVASQSRRGIRGGDFAPIPCSHPNCGWLSLMVRRFGLGFHLTRHIDIASATQKAAYKTVLDRRQLSEVVGTAAPSLMRRWASAAGRRVVRPGDIFAVAVKPFMDRYNYDQDRVSHCCHHTMTTTGELTSFCEYNALLRPGDGWDALDRMPCHAEPSG